MSTFYERTAGGLRPLRLVGVHRGEGVVDPLVASVAQQGGQGGTGTETVGKLTAAHTPGRVLLGVAAPDSGQARPQYPEAVAIIAGRPGDPDDPGYLPGVRVFERRVFDNARPNRAQLDSALLAASRADVLLVHSFAFPSVEWADVAAGRHDGLLQVIADRAKAQRVVNGGSGRPWVQVLNHEPDGDDGATGELNLTRLRDHAGMNNRAALWLAGFRPDPSGALTVYTPAEDVRDVVTFGVILNGHWWALDRARYEAHPDRIAAAAPRYLLDTLDAVGGAFGVDVYDPNPNDGAGGYKPGTQRTWLKLDAVGRWAGANRVRALFVGEFAVATDEVDKVWQVLHAGRNGDSNGYATWIAANYFDSMVNARLDWRLLLDTYPASAYVSSKGLADQGGTPLTERRLNAFRRSLLASARA